MHANDEYRIVVVRDFAPKINVQKRTGCHFGIQINVGPMYVSDAE
jgi:hypothetical protein